MTQLQKDFCAQLLFKPHSLPEATDSGSQATQFISEATGSGSRNY